MQTTMPDKTSAIGYSHQEIEDRFSKLRSTPWYSRDIFDRFLFSIFRGNPQTLDDALECAFYGPPQYYLLDRIGRGAFKVTYRAVSSVGKDQEDFVLVAVKVLHPTPKGEDILGEQPLSQVLIRQSRTQDIPTDPHLCRVLGVYSAPHKEDPKKDLLYIVEQFCPGGRIDTLYPQLKDFGNNPNYRAEIDLPKATDLIIQVASGLLALHSWENPFRTVNGPTAKKSGSFNIGIPHGDLKPANMLVDSKGKIKLTDYEVTHQRSLRKGALNFGYPMTTAPELLCTDEPSTFEGDAFSLGVNFFRMITGNYPVPVDRTLSEEGWTEMQFEVRQKRYDKPMKESYQRITQDELRQSLKQQLQAFPELVFQIIGSLMNKEPEERIAIRKAITQLKRLKSQLSKSENL